MKVAEELELLLGVLGDGGVVLIQKGEAPHSITISARKRSLTPFKGVYGPSHDTIEPVTLMTSVGIENKLLIGALQYLQSQWLKATGVERK